MTLTTSGSRSNCGLVKDAASYYIQASEKGGEPPGAAGGGPGAEGRLALEPGQVVPSVGRMSLLFGGAQGPLTAPG